MSEFDHGHVSGSSVATQQSLSSVLDDIGVSENARIFGTEFVALNNSGVSGSALVIRDGRTLTVSIEADGLEPDQVHPQHIHGLLGEVNSTSPTIRQDTDLDGFVELVEGLATYGPVLLNLATDPELAAGVAIGDPAPDGLEFPMADADGHISYAETFSFANDGEADAAMAELFDELTPVDRREIVLHGLTLEEGQGAVGGPAPDEADGTAGYKAVLPVASGELERITTEEDLLAFSNHFAGGEETAFGSSNDLLFIM